MNIIAVAKDEQMLLDMSDVLQKVYPGSHVELFVDPLWAVKYSFNNQTQLAFVATEIHRVDCFKLEGTLKKVSPNITVVFIANDEDDAADIEMFDELCVCKPVTEDAIKKIRLPRCEL